MSSKISGSDGVLVTNHYINNQDDEKESISYDSLNYIFDNFSIFDLIRCERVSKLWYAAARQHKFWKVLQHTIFPLGITTIRSTDSSKTARENVAFHCKQPILGSETFHLMKEGSPKLKELLVSLPVTEWDEQFANEISNLSDVDAPGLGGPTPKYLLAFFSANVPVIVMYNWQLKEHEDEDGEEVFKLTRVKNELADLVVVIPKSSESHDIRVCLKFMHVYDDQKNSFISGCIQMTAYKKKDSGKIYLGQGKNDSEETVFSDKELSFAKLVEKMLTKHGLL